MKLLGRHPTQNGFKFENNKHSRNIWALYEINQENVIGRVMSVTRIHFIGDIIQL